MMFERIKKAVPFQKSAVFAGFVFCIYFSVISASFAQAPSTHLPGQVIAPVRQYAGSPYFIEEWSRGAVVLNNGQIAKDLLLRYDGFSDRLIWLLPTEGNKQVSIDKYLVEGFVLHQADTSYHFSRIDVSGLTGFTDNQVFLQVLQQGKFSFLAFRGVRQSSRLGSVTDPQGRVRQALTLISETKYFLQLPDGSLKRVRLNRRSFMQAVGDEMPEVIERLKGTNMRFRSEADLAKTVSRLNNLSGL